VILGHIWGIPVEESVLLAPAGATTLTVAAVLGRAKLFRLLTEIRRCTWER
jgi:hypothetical protein